jgi:hypothetical protein
MRAKTDGQFSSITEGDDTTIIAADILARLGISVIGIVDGDQDRITADRLTG